MTETNASVAQGPCISLLACPFCGGQARFAEHEGGEWIECAECTASTVCMYPNKEDVKELLAERWNIRLRTHRSVTELCADNSNLAEYVRQMETEIEQLKANKDLVREVMFWHRDKESSDYNECDTAPCHWCERAQKVIDELPNTHPARYAQSVVGSSESKGKTR